MRKKGGRGEGRMGGESQRGTSSLAEVIVKVILESELEVVIA